MGLADQLGKPAFRQSRHSCFGGADAREENAVGRSDVGSFTCNQGLHAETLHRKGK